MNKKLYIAPTLELKNVQIESMILAASPHAADSGTVGENTPSGIGGSGPGGQVTGGGGGMNDAKHGTIDWDF